MRGHFGVNTLSNSINKILKEESKVSLETLFEMYLDEIDEWNQCETCKSFQEFSGLSCLEHLLFKELSYLFFSDSQSPKTP